MGLERLASDAKHGFHARTAKDELFRGGKTCFQLIDFLNKPTGLSQSAMKSRIGVIKDFYKSSILEIGIQSLLSMVTGRGFTYDVVLHTNLLYS